MTADEIRQEFLRGRNCAQCVLEEFGEETCFDIKETDRMAACFGGGMYMGQTCGAVTGALMAIGMAGGGREQAEEFEKKFSENCGSCVCSELLSGMMPAAARESGRMLEVCPGYVETAVRLLREILE